MILTIKVGVKSGYKEREGGDFFMKTFLFGPTHDLSTNTLVKERRKGAFDV